MEKNSSGQILLIILLAMTTITVVVLSVVSRSVTEVSITSAQDESLRAFSAAEAGIEEALVQAVSPGQVIQNDLGIESTDVDSSYSASIDAYPNASKEYNYPFDLSSGESATLWFLPHNGDGSVDFTCTAGTCYVGDRLNICWGINENGNSDSLSPAMVFTVVYEDALGNLQSARAGYDPYNTRTSSNNFLNPNNGNCTVGEKTYRYRAQVDMDNFSINWSTPGTLKYAKIRLLYNTDRAHPVGVESVAAGSTNFPAQGKVISSLGSSGTATRRVEVFSLYPEAPDVFDNALFSGGGITK